MTRVETFTDAAFAFALTLLVISFDTIPSSYDEFLDALRRIPAFAASFAQIAVFWYAHHEWSRRFGLDDLPTAVFSLLLVFCTLVYVYPLRIIFSALFHWLSGGALPFELQMTGPQQLAGLFVIYGLGFTAMASCIILLYRHALKHSRALGLDARESFAARRSQQVFLIYGATGLVSALLGLFLPPRLGVYAGFAYATLAITMPLFSWLKWREAEQLGYGKTDAASQ